MTITPELTLVALDFSEASRCALQHAVQRLRAEEEPSLLLLHVVELGELEEISRLTKTSEVTSSMAWRDFLKVETMKRSKQKTISAQTSPPAT